MTIFTSLVIFYIGAALGSFLSVVIYRVRHGESGILIGRSHCPHCKRLLVAVDLMPIASYVIHSGRCRYCKEKISPSYLLIEILMGVVLAALYLHFPFIDFPANIPAPTLIYPALWEFVRYGLVMLVLVAIFFYDLLYQEIPDIFTYTGIVIALIGSLISGVPIPQEYIPGAAFGALFFETQLLLSKGKWVGSGDVILGTLMGVLLGWKALILALFIAYLLGSIVGLWLLFAKKASKTTKIPFAPFLVTGTILSVLFGSQIIDWYLGMFFT